LKSGNVSLDLLRTFQAIHQAGSLTQAADLLGVSQPTVTNQLRQLEAAVGYPLFQRVARGVMPTSSAEDLARQLDGPLDTLLGIAGRLGTSPRLSGTTLRLGGPADFVTTLVLPALKDTADAGVAVRTHLGDAFELLKDLATGRLDLVISTVRPRRSGLQVAALTDEEFVLIAAPALASHLDEPLLTHDPAAALRALPLLAYAEDLPIVRRWWRHVLGTPPPHRAALVVPDLRGLQAAAIAGLGATVLPRYLIGEDLAAGRLVELAAPEDPPINTLYLACRSPARTEPHVDHAWRTLSRAARSW
jgi:DNA-binding transcriptional LysR family regulator